MPKIQLQDNLENLKMQNFVFAVLDARKAVYMCMVSSYNKSDGRRAECSLTKQPFSAIITVQNQLRLIGLVARPGSIMGGEVPRHFL